MSTNGKGSTRRPAAVDRDTLASNWERTFGGGAPSDVVEEGMAVSPTLESVYVKAMREVLRGQRESGLA